MTPPSAETPADGAAVPALGAATAAPPFGAADAVTVDAAAIAAAVGVSRRTTERRAKDEDWPCQGRGRAGDPRRYPVAGLPADIRAALQRTAQPEMVAPGTPVAAEPATDAPGAAPVPTALPAPAILTDAARRTLEARAALLAEADRLADSAGTRGGWVAALATLVDLARRGALDPTLQALVPWANARGGATGSRTLSVRTLHRWAAARAAGGTGGLAPAVPAPHAPAVPAWAPALLAEYRRPQQPSLRASLDRLAPHLPAGVAAPSYDQARRFLRQLSVVERERGRRGPMALLALQGFRRRDTSGLEPLDVAVADGHTLKAEIAHPAHGKPFRPEVTAVIDAATRFAFGWSAGLAESAWTVMDAIRHGVVHLGPFAIFYTDNGSGFVAEAMTSEVLGLLGRLGAVHETARPYRAQSRGLIERAQASLWLRPARDLATYAGRDMDREARRATVRLVKADLDRATRSGAVAAGGVLPSWPDFLRWAQDAVDAYNGRPHRALPKIRDPETGRLRHQTPAECLAAWRARGWTPATLTAAEAEDLFRPWESRVVRRCEVSLPWGRYFAPALEPYHGDTVRVGYDIHDGSRVWVRDGAGRLLAVAVRDGNLTPYMPASKVEHGRAQRAARRLALVTQRAADIEAERRGGEVIEGPAPIPDAAAVPAGAARLLIQAEDERRATEDAARAEADAGQAAAHAATIADFAAAADRRRREETDRDRFRRWLGVDAAIAAGEAVDEADRRWWQVYQTTSEYRGLAPLYEEYGDLALGRSQAGRAEAG